MRGKEAIEENKALIVEFPFLLPRNRWTGNVPDDYDYSYTELDDLPDGWRIAFGLQMCRELKEILVKGGGLDVYRITQIKEKNGTLRWYDNGCPESVSNAYYSWQKGTLSFHGELASFAEREQRRSLWGILLIIAKNVQVNVPMEILKI